MTARVSAAVAAPLSTPNGAQSLPPLCRIRLSLAMAAENAAPGVATQLPCLLASA